MSNGSRNEDWKNSKLNILSHQNVIKKDFFAFLLGTFVRVFRDRYARNKGAAWINYEEIDQMELDEIDEEIKLEFKNKK